MKLLALFVLLWSLAVASDYSANPYVFDLSPSNFDKVVQRTNYTTIVKFYAPWCGYCQQLEPVYSKLGRYVHHDGKYAVNVAAVNCDLDANKALCAQHQVLGFPTLMVFRPPKYDIDTNTNKNARGRHAVETYNGERTLKAMWLFILSRLKNYVKRFPQVDSASLAQWLEGEASDGFKRAVLLTENRQISPMLKLLAIDFLGSYRFGVVSVKGAVTQVAGRPVPPTDLPVLLTLNAKGEFEAMEVGKRSDITAISKWLAAQNGGKPPAEGPISKKETKFYSKYRAGRRHERDEL